MSEKRDRVLLCGIGGSGMSALALALMARGTTVFGSDRAYDAGQSKEKFAQLSKAGIHLVAQDGSALDESFDCLIVSAAVEEHIPDVKAARKLNIPVRKRAEVLAQLFNDSRGIAVGGTSGKSTTTAMIAHILQQCGQAPTVINGAVMQNAVDASVKGLGNAMIGTSDRMVIEADESDGSIVLYKPAVAVVTNISLDHKPVAEITPLFESFIKASRVGAVINLDNRGSASLAGLHPETMTFSLSDKNARLLAEETELTADRSRFSVRTTDGASARVTLNQPGRHNVENALAALGAALLAGIGLAQAAEALKSFSGVKRRLEVLGSAAGITVIDDFAHNPDKISAALATLKQAPGRLLILFQPHGFEPMRLMGAEIARVFAQGLEENDVLLVPEILYKGGTVKKDISAEDLTKAVVQQGRQALFAQDRSDLLNWLETQAQAGDRIVMMGARDDSLTDDGLDLINRFKRKAA